MGTIDQDILAICRKIWPQVVDWRRHLHQYPELSFQEHNTARYIEQELRRLGVTNLQRISDTGIVALIIGTQSESDDVIALRADTDALPITEENDVSYKSSYDGIMHACGHDVHTASLLGVAATLLSLRARFSGTIKLIFQPGEEKLPGGASILIKEGVLDDPKPKLIIGQHVHPPLRTGHIGFRAGKYMASADEIRFTVKGKGGHAALPQDNIDPVIITAQILVGLQQIVARRADPSIPTVLSFGKINSKGGATNIIPDEIYVEGTFRTFDESWRATAHKLIQAYVVDHATVMGGSADFEIKKGYPVLHNNVPLTEYLKNEANKLLGPSSIVSLPIRLSSEDFSYYSQEIPACFYRLGTGNAEKDTQHSVHTPKFNIDEDALLTSVQTMTHLAIRALDYTENELK